MKFIQRLSQRFRVRARTLICGEMLLLALCCLGLLAQTTSGRSVLSRAARLTSGGGALFTPLKWVDFTIPCEALNQAFRFDVDTCQSELHLNWVDLLACLGSRYGGDFSRYQSTDLEELVRRLQSGETTLEQLTAGLPSYAYYRQAYGAVLDGMVGEFQAEIPASESPGIYLPSGVDGGAEGDPETVRVTKYGLKAFSPIARDFPYSDYDDFGNTRSYGGRRQHLGHDMMGQVGTPVIAVESGRVEAIGWNQYGGWRLGIRSFDGRRYYYYAHLRQNYPYQSGLAEGSIVQAGDVIGYLGHTGYSTTENTNNIDEPHLHWGLELIFDEERREKGQEIWIDCYALSQFLTLNRSQVEKVEGTKEWRRVYQTEDPETAAARQTLSTSGE